MVPEGGSVGIVIAFNKANTSKKILLPTYSRVAQSLRFHHPGELSVLSEIVNKSRQVPLALWL
jgi:hypothetical protein